MDQTSKVQPRHRNQTPSPAQLQMGFSPPPQNPRHLSLDPARLGWGLSSLQQHPNHAAPN